LPSEFNFYIAIKQHVDCIQSQCSNYTAVRATNQVGEEQNTVNLKQTTGS